MWSFDTCLVVSLSSTLSSVSHTDSLYGVFNAPQRDSSDRCWLCVVTETEGDITSHLEGKDAIGSLVVFEIWVERKRPLIIILINHYFIFWVADHWHTFRTFIHYHALLLINNLIRTSSLYMNVGGLLVGSCFLKCAKSLWRITWLLVEWVDVIHPQLCPPEFSHTPSLCCE